MFPFMLIKQCFNKVEEVVIASLIYGLFPFLLIKQCFSKIEEEVCMLCEDYSFHRNLF